jgi:hypothetical protein
MNPLGTLRCTLSIVWGIFDISIHDVSGVLSTLVFRRLVVITSIVDCWGNDISNLSITFLLSSQVMDFSTMIVVDYIEVIFYFSWAPRLILKTWDFPVRHIVATSPCYKQNIGRHVSTKPISLLCFIFLIRKISKYNHN